MPISRAPVAGVMRSTMPFGKADIASIQSAKPGSERRARPETAAWVTSRFQEYCRQDMICERRNALGARSASPARMRPKTGFLSRRIARILDDAGCAGSKTPDAGIDEIAAFGDRQGTIG